GTGHVFGHGTAFGAAEREPLEPHGARRERIENGPRRSTGHRRARRCAQVVTVVARAAGAFVHGAAVRRRIAGPLRQHDADTHDEHTQEGKKLSGHGSMQVPLVLSLSKDASVHRTRNRASVESRAMDRREFLKSAAAIPAGLHAARTALI